MTSKVYIMENLDCANCASKIERKIASLPGVQEVSITFSAVSRSYEVNANESIP